MTVNRSPLFLCAWICTFLFGCSSAPEHPEPYRSAKAHAMNEVGLKNYREGRLEDALRNFYNALDHAMASDNRAEAVRAHINIGQVLADQDLLDEAKTHFDAAYRIADDEGDEGLLYSTLRSLRGYMYRTEQYREAEESIYCQFL